MNHEPKNWLKDIMFSCEAIEAYTANSDKEEFLHSQDLQDKVMWRFTIIGEAVKNLGSELTKNYPNVEWQQAADMRNFAVHEYFGIDFVVIWTTVTEDLPQFKNQILEILKSL